ncbi:MAG: hypothetical protein LBV26_09285 [Bacteroidales bacterium]|jgi:hypothetical protein|nr:hypothetical protein [Bacteroidales bacterium]
MITINLCVSDIPRNKVKQADNGKKYINLILSERREPDMYGNTHTLIVSKTKEEREASAATVYVGSGKLYHAKPVTAEDIDNMPVADNTDDLPF